MDKIVEYHFYILKDPRDGLIKYVGRTVDPKSRMRNHVYEAKKNCRNKRERWIHKLLSLNLFPIMDVVYTEICSLEDAIATEKMLVRKLSKRYELKNSPDNFLGAVLTGNRVFQYDRGTGELLGSFRNSNQAYIQTGVKDSNILRCCKGQSKSAGGYFWSFDEYAQYPEKYSPWETSGKVVVQLNQQGDFIAEYRNAREAFRITGVDYRTISEACRGKVESGGGFLWRFKENVDSLHS